MNRQRFLHGAVATVLFVACFVGFSSLSHLTLGFNKSVAPLWPGTGLLLAALLLTRPGQWWYWAALATTTSTIQGELSVPAPSAVLLQTTLIGVAQALVQAGLMARWLKRPVRFERLQDVLVLAVIVAAVNLVTTPLAAIAVSVIRSDNLLVYMRTRWLSHTLTAMTLTPFVVTWVTAWRERAAWRWRPLLPWVALLAFTFVIVWLAIMPGSRLEPLLPAPFLCLLPLVTAAMLFHSRGATLITVVVMLHVMIAVSRGDASPEGNEVVSRLARAQFFLGIIAVTGLLLGTSMAEIDARSRLLGESEERYRSAMHNSAIGMALVSLEGRWLEVNPKLCQITGYTREELLQRDFHSLVVPDDRGAGREKAQDLVSGAAASVEIAQRQVHKSGRLVWVHVTSTIVRDDAGRPLYFVMQTQDMTESAGLKAQLQQAQKMEALGNLAAGVAHDFNTLLSGINVFVEMASTTLAPSHEATSLLKQARRGASSARALVQRILNYSRGTKLATPTTCNLVELVRDTAPLLAAILPPNVSLSLETQCAQAQVRADPAQLQQILINLSTNAAQAIGEKPGRVELRIGLCQRNGANAPAAPSPTPPSHVRVSVTDNGCGIDANTRAHIFDPYFTTKKDGDGTGLGLVIVRDIVAAHSGELEVESVVGQGTTFSVRLPLERAAAGAAIAAVV